MTDEEMTIVYGTAASRAEHKRGDRVRYTDPEFPNATGVIVWIAAAANARPMQYIVETEHRSGMLDFISPGDVIEVLNAQSSLDQAQLLEIANTAIAQSRVEKWTEEKTRRVAIAACVRFVEKHGRMSDQTQIAIAVIVEEALYAAPTTVRCPYCRQIHYTQHVERCPLRS